MRPLCVAAFIVGVILIPTSLGLAKLDQDRAAAHLERTLVAETDEHGAALDDYFARARSVILLTANSPAFANVLAEPGTRRQKVLRQGRNIREVTHHLGYLERLYPGSIGEACLIDGAGEELARVVRGDVAPPSDLSTEEEQASFFAPAFALRLGQVHQTRPYVSPDTKEWVVANATPIPQPDGVKRAIVHFEVTIESFRRAIGQATGTELRVVDAATGRVVIDGERPQRVGAHLGMPEDARFTALGRTASRAGVTEVAGRKVAYRRIRSTAGNANDWILVAAAERSTIGFIAGMGPAPPLMLAVALMIIFMSSVSLRTSRRKLETQATTDPLTGLGNRRELMADLERAVRTAKGDEPVVLTLFDLNGFKNYNDTFGHPAGDALLLRLGDALAQAVAPFGAARTGREATSSASSPAPSAGTCSNRPHARRSRRPARALRSRPPSGRS